MKHKRLLISAVVFIVICVATGFFVPLGSYTTVNGCPSETTPIKRLSLVAGETLENARSNDKPQTNPLVGCSQNIEYVQYFF